MSGLNLLCEYSSDSENEITTSDDVEEFATKKLPLPEVISNWKGVIHHDEIISDPSKHEGRIRSFEHERGNWATLVYIKYVPSSNMFSWMNQIKSQVTIDNIYLHEEFHISLTRTLILKYHWIDSFVESIKSVFATVPKFSIRLMDLKVYCNENKTRTFLGLCCVDETGMLEYVTRQLNLVLSEYKMPPFYEDASHHISFLWCLGDQTKQLNKLLPDLIVSLDQLFKDCYEDVTILVDKVSCKIGNRNYVFQLKD